MTEQQVRLESMRNQMLVNLDACLPDICRLSSSVPRRTRDEQIIAMVLCFVGGWLHERRGDAALMEQH